MRHGKVFSVYSDLRTRKSSLFFLILGLILLVLTLLQYAFNIFSAKGDLAGIPTALTMLCFGACAILYFFSRMFGKLAEIASEVENDESLRDDSTEEDSSKGNS